VPLKIYKIVNLYTGHYLTTHGNWTDKTGKTFAGLSDARRSLKYWSKRKDTRLAAIVEYRCVTQAQERIVGEDE
jgi:hypothetical protein